MKKNFTTALLTLIFPWGAWAGSVGLSTTQSESSSSIKLRASFKPGQDHRLSFSGSKSKLKNSTDSDQDANSAKMTYKYLYSKDFDLSFDLKKSDEYYGFIGQGGAIKTSFVPFRYEWDEKKSLETRLQFKIEKQVKSYSKHQDDSLEQQILYFGIDQEFTPSVTVGLDFTKNSYKGNSTAVQRSLDEKTIATPNASDINSYTQGLVDQSMGGYAEYSAGTWVLGMSVASDLPMYSQSKKSTSFDLYFDVDITNSISVNASAGQSKTEESQSSPTKTYSVGLNYSF